MTEAPELRRARFHLLRAEDALTVALASLRAAPVPDSAQVLLTDHARAIQQQVQELLGLLDGTAQLGGSPGLTVLAEQGRDGWAGLAELGRGRT